VLVAARFGFPPNRLELCGPGESRAILDYLAEGTSDRGLEHVLKQFAGAYPYLSFIAASNHIEDPFDPRVVEAYWVGNELLDHVRMADFYRHVEERFQRRAPRRLFEAVLGQIPEGARPHHNFHVFAIPIRTGRVEIARTLQTLDECRISWGTVVGTGADELAVQRRPLTMHDDDLTLGPEELRTVRWRFSGKTLCQARAGDFVAIHWGCVCDRLTPSQVLHLQRETEHHLSLVNRKHRIASLA
jgi:hypothetical protein